jgi:hypothetical protein
MISATAPAAMSDSKRVSMYSTPWPAVRTSRLVPGEAERRASDSIRAVTSSLMLGLMTRSFIFSSGARSGSVFWKSSGNCSRYFADVRRRLGGGPVGIAAGDGAVKFPVFLDQFRQVADVPEQPVHAALQGFQCGFEETVVGDAGDGVVEFAVGPVGLHDGALGEAAFGLVQQPFEILKVVGWPVWRPAGRPAPPATGGRRRGPPRPWG